MSGEKKKGKTAVEKSHHHLRGALPEAFFWLVVPKGLKTRTPQHVASCAQTRRVRCGGACFSSCDARARISFKKGVRRRRIHQTYTAKATRGATHNARLCFFKAWRERERERRSSLTTATLDGFQPTGRAFWFPFFSSAPTAAAFTQRASLLFFCFAVLLPCRTRPLPFHFFPFLWFGPRRASERETISPPGFFPALGERGNRPAGCVFPPCA